MFSTFSNPAIGISLTEHLRFEWLAQRAICDFRLLNDHDIQIDLFTHKMKISGSIFTCTKSWLYFAFSYKNFNVLA